MPHNLIISHLYEIGLIGDAIELFTSYFDKRRQYVEFNGTKSSIINASSGVPEGGLMSPTLFGLTVRKMNKSVNHSALYQFADDTLLAKALCVDLDNERLQEDVNSLIEYSIENGSELHPDKSVVLDISLRASHPDETTININGKILESPTELKYLGVIIDSQVKMSMQTNHVQ